jgi:hypothetical protein
MKKRGVPESRLWNALLLIHLVLYSCCWVLALHYLSTLNLSDYAFHTYTMGILVALAWTPLLFLHIGIHYYAAGRRSTDERAIYREGFADAMHQLADRSYDARRLTPDEEDEAEWVELSEKRKRG